MLEELEDRFDVERENEAGGGGYKFHATLQRDEKCRTTGWYRDEGLETSARRNEPLGTSPIFAIPAQCRVTSSVFRNVEKPAHFITEARASTMRSPFLRSLRCFFLLPSPSPIPTSPKAKGLTPHCGGALVY